MTETPKLQITYLPADEITVGERLRDAQASGVAAIEASIGEIGFITPLHVQKVKGGGYALLDGLHRLRASQRAGLDEVPCIIHRGGKTDGLKIEVGTALGSAPLDPLSTAVFLARHKALYEAENPEAKRLSAANAARLDLRTVQNTVRSFADNAAETFGWSSAKVFKLIAVGSSLSPEDVSQLRQAPNKVTVGDLQALSKIEPAMRSLVCRELGLGKVKSVREVLDRKKQPGKKAVSALEQEARKLADAWARASKAARRAFVEDHSDALLGLLEERSDTSAEIVTFKARERS